MSKAVVAAVREYLALENPAHGDMKRIARKHRANYSTVVHRVYFERELAENGMSAA